MLKSAFRAVVRQPLEVVSRSHFAGPGTCLTYHRISPDSYQPDCFSPNLVLRVSANQFERQMKHLSENFDCLSLDEFHKRLSEGKLDSRSVVVTVDDGYRDNLELALPILKKYQVPATIYLTTGLMDGTLGSLWWEVNEEIVRKLDRIELNWRGETFQWDTSHLAAKRKAFGHLHSLFLSAAPEEQEAGAKQLRAQAGINQPPPDAQALTWEEVVRLSQDPLITIGAHSVTHAVLSRLSRETLKKELGDSKATLEKRLEKPIHHFAYPFGDENSAAKREFEVALECGYRTAVTTRLGHAYAFHKDYPHAIPRITVAYGDDFAHFTWKLAGLECMLKRPLSRFIPDSYSKPGDPK